MRDECQCQGRGWGRSEPARSSWRRGAKAPREAVDIPQCDSPCCFPRKVVLNLAPILSFTHFQGILSLCKLKVIPLQRDASRSLFQLLVTSSCRIKGQDACDLSAVFLGPAAHRQRESARISTRVRGGARGCEAQNSLVRAVILDCHPRPEGWFAKTADLDQPHHPLPMARPRLQDFQHPVVVNRGADQRPTHHRR